MTLPPESDPTRHPHFEGEVRFHGDVPAGEQDRWCSDEQGGPAERDRPVERDSIDDEPILAERVETSVPSATLATSNAGALDRSEWDSTLGGEPRSRWWSPLAIAAVSLAMFIMTSTVMALVALLVVHGEISPEIFRDPEPMKLVSQSRLGLFLVVVVPQAALVMPSIVAAWISPVPFRQRLGLIRGNWPVWTWLAVGAATPLVGMVSGLVVGLFLDESAALKEMTEIFRGHGQNGFLFPLALMIGATPAICEEFLFRGYIQTRLTKSLGPILGVGIASFLFAAFHLDLVHVIAVFPLGLFLGWVTWQSGSLFPAMLGHFVNNVISVVAVVVAPEENPDVLALPAVAFTLSILAAGLIGMAVVSVASVAYRRGESEALSAAETQVA